MKSFKNKKDWVLYCEKNFVYKHPDFKGSIKINGVEHWFDAWTKEGKNGKFISGRIGDPKQKGFTPKGDDEMPVKDDDFAF